MSTPSTPRSDGSKDGPLPPVPPVGPPKHVGSFWNAIKVFLIAVIGLALKYAWTANGHFTNWDNFQNLNHWSDLALVTFNGFVYGLIPGIILGFLVLLAAWAGPELWAWLGPVILVAAARTMNFVRGMSRSFRGLPDTTPHTQPPENEKRD